MIIAADSSLIRNVREEKKGKRSPHRHRIEKKKKALVEENCEDIKGCE